MLYRKYCRGYAALLLFVLDAQRTSGRRDVGHLAPIDRKLLIECTSRDYHQTAQARLMKSFTEPCLDAPANLKGTLLA